MTPLETVGVNVGLPGDVSCRFGITRVGEITGLDVIGIPVSFACRPNSRGLAVAQGKGLSLEQARISAVMEALEGAVAERTEALTQCIESINGMIERQLPLIRLADVLKCDPARLDKTRPRRWMEGQSLSSGKPVWAPLELIGLDFRRESDFDHRAFRMDSVGLGAGFSAAHATLHALLELVENDATAFFETFANAWSKAAAVHVADARNAELLGLLQRLESLSIAVSLRNLTTDLGIPVVAAIIPMPPHENSGGGERFAAGFAARFDPEEAALAALLEAIQSRLTDIAGSRDDILEEDYISARKSRRPPPRETVAIGSLRMGSELNGAPAEIAIGALVSRLRSRGIGDLHVFDLPSGIEGLHVVRVVATDLEVGTDRGVARMGSRMLKRIFT